MPVSTVVDSYSAESQTLLSPPPALAATTCLIAAERALQHLEYNLPKIDKILSVFQIPQSDYGVYAGFDEGLMQAGLGYLEQIHVFIRSEVPDMPSLLSRLGSIFAPFPAILFTETSFYYIPVEATENVARSNELVQVTVSKSIDNGINTRTRPIAICLTHTSASNSTKGIGSGTESNRQNSGNDNEQSDRQEESNEDKLSDSNKNGVGQGLGPEPSGREGNQTSGKANIYWDIVSEICSSQPDEEPRVVSQRLYTKGGLMIKRTSETIKLNQFATCKVQFTELSFRSERLTEKMNYGLFHTTVNINSLQRNADVPHFEPKRTRKFMGVSKVTSASKSGLSNTASSTVPAAITPQATFGANTAQTRETSTGTEKTMNTSRISQKDMYGAIEWGFHVVDPYEKESGMILNPDNLPRVNFTFVGDNDTPAAPPQNMNIEVRTYWSSLPRSDNQTARRWPFLNLGNKPFYSNLCHISILRVPSTLQEVYNYRATLYVFPQQTDEGITSHQIEVRHKAGPINVTVGVDHTIDVNETEWAGSSALTLSRDGESPRQLGEGSSDIRSH